MKRLSALLFGVLFAATLAYAAEKVFSINKWGGLNTDDAELLLEDNETPDAENVITDEFKSLGPRKGFVDFSTNTATNIWTFPHSNGTKYIIIESGGYLKADTGTGAFSTSISTVSTTDVTVATVLGDKFYFANKTDGLKYWDTSSVTSASPTLKVDNLVTWKGRLAASGKSGAERTIFLSKFLVGTSWDLVTNPSDDDPAQITVSGSLDEEITALYPAFNDVLIWFKQTAFGGIYGSRRSNFVQRTFSDRIGTAYRDSIQDCDGTLVWLGPQRTMWGFDGTNYEKISEKIDTMMGTAAQGDANARANTLTTQTDFNTGTNFNTSNAVSAGDVMLSTWTDTDTTGDDFAAGTLVDLTTSTVSGSLYIAYNSTDVLNNDFESGTTTDADDWTENVGTIRTSTSITPQSGSYALVFNSNRTSSGGSDCSRDQTSISLPVYVYADGAVVQTSLFTYSTSWVQYGFSMASMKGRYIQIEFIGAQTMGLGAGGCGALNYSGGAKSTAFVSNGESIYFYAKAFGTGNKQLAWDLVEDGRSSVAGGTLVSQTFDTAISSPSWLASTPTYTTNSQSLSFQTQTSSAATGPWSSLVTWTPGSAPTSTSNRYIRYKITMGTAGSGGTGMPYVDDVTLAARSSTGTFIGPSVSLGSINSFGVFEADSTLNDGTITYAIYTDTDSSKTITNGVPVAGTYGSSQTITSGAVPTVSTAAYAFVAASFAVTAATQTPTNHSLTLRWNEGNQTRVASAYTNQRYWLSVAVNSATNNRIFVYDRNQNWQRYSGINANAMNLYNSNLYFANSTGIFQGESGTTDDGAAIAAYYKTKSWALSGPETRTTFYDLYMKTKESAATLETQFYLNGQSTANDLGDYTMNATSGNQSFKLPFSFGSVQQGLDIGIKWSVSSTVDWQIYNGNIYYDSDPNPN